MKKSMCSLVLLLSVNVLFGQWTTSGTNIYNTNTGNVGIGTNTPNWLLEVRKDQATDTRIVVRNNMVNINAKARYELSTGTPLSYVISELNDFNGTPYYLFSVGSAVIGAYFDAPEFTWRKLNGTTTMKMNSSGALLIGNIPTTPGAYKLFVEGGVLTEKVRVAVKSTSDWADYVFDKNYKVMPLRQLKDFISTNGHLPGIPTTREVMKEGIDLGDMNKKLLEKIEEMTLYILQLNEANEKLREEVKEIKAGMKQASN